MPLHQGLDVSDSQTLSASQANRDHHSGSEPASLPRFLMSVSDDSLGSRNQIKLGKHNSPQDLVFSIDLEQSETNQHMLMELTLDIALGASDASTYFLMSNYTGPGTSMLTNLRFNAFIMMYHDQNHDRYYLRIRLLPRTPKGWVKASTVSELGFLLGMANINTPEHRLATTTIQSRARYCKNPDFALEESNVMVVENPPLSVSVVVA